MPKYRQVIRRTAAQADAEAELAEVDYRQLQARAKELEIPADQSADALREAIAEAEANGGSNA